MDRKHRCAYFKWADTESKSKKHLDERAQSSSRDSVDEKMRYALWTRLSNGRPPIQIQLCTLLQDFFKTLVTKEIKTFSHDDEEGGDRRLRKASNKNIDIPLRKSFCDRSLEEDDRDGVHFSRQKLGRFSKSDVSKESVFTSKSLSTPGDEYNIVEASLDLLSLIAENTLKAVEKSSNSWEGWFAPLCEVLSSNELGCFHSQAKTMLRRLCGGRPSIYHKVRDHYFFDFQFLRLMKECAAPLEAALNVREKARRCGTKWKQSELTWISLPAGGLIGVEDLITEDALTVKNSEAASKILTEIIDFAKGHSKNWRHFCALDSLPQKNESRANSIFRCLPACDGMFDRSPICLLLWIACSSTAPNQYKVLTLMNTALDSPVDSSKNVTFYATPPHQEDDLPGVSTDGGTDLEGMTGVKANSDLPERALLEGASGLSIDDIYAFIIAFVLNGKTWSIQRVASSIAGKIVSSSPSNDISSLIEKLLTVCPREIGDIGCNTTEFLHFLRSLIVQSDCSFGAKFQSITSTIVHYFTQQMQLHLKSKSSVEAKGEIDNYTFDFNLSSFPHCHASKSVFKPTTNSSTSKADMIPEIKRTKSNEPDNVESTESSAKAEVTRPLEQMRALGKIRLDHLILNSVSTEFSNHIQLKSRMAISEIRLNTSEQRGRYVKVIGIFFSPRPVRHISELKSVEYEPNWQKFGTIVLSRGSCRGTCKVTTPIVSANLKIEFQEFYERKSGSRSSSGALILHCPRCARVVNNAHGGVCGHCGEVAFQCRKCRHINYDRLDAFLCVECGYCSSGTFSFELMAGIASNAVAITDDNGLERAVRCLRVASKKLNEVRNSLNKHLSKHESLASKKRRRAYFDEDNFEAFCPPLKRALNGDLPKVSSRNPNERFHSSESGRKRRASIRESLTSSLRRSDPLQRPSNRSLLGLARQIRGQSSSSDERSSLGALLSQQSSLNSGFSSSFIFDDSEDVLGMINGTADSHMQLDVQDPISRIMANIQARVRGNSSTISAKRDNESDEDVIESKKRDGSVPKNVTNEEEERQKLLIQMKESSRTCIELRKRIIAWKRLNKDAIADYGYSRELCPIALSPVSCAVCDPTIIRLLLSVVHALLQVKSKKTEDALSREFVRILFERPFGGDPDFFDLQQEVLVTIATKSDAGSNIIFEELKARLNGVKDATSEIILGKILEADACSNEKYVELAVQILSDKALT